MVNRMGKGGSSDRFLFLCSKIAADVDCSHEIRRWLLLGREAMTNLDSVLESKNITLLTKVRRVEAMVFPHAKNWLIGKDPDAGKDWRQEEKGMTEDEIVGWHYWFNGHELGQTLGDGEWQGSLVWCNSLGPRGLDMTWLLNNNYAFVCVRIKWKC